MRAIQSLPEQTYERLSTIVRGDWSARTGVEFHAPFLRQHAQTLLFLKPAYIVMASHISDASSVEERPTMSQLYLGLLFHLRDFINQVQEVVITTYDDRSRDYSALGSPQRSTIRRIIEARKKHLIKQFS